MVIVIIFEIYIDIFIAYTLKNGDNYFGYIGFIETTSKLKEDGAMIFFKMVIIRIIKL
jgi:hypothetical protein